MHSAIWFINFCNIFNNLRSQIISHNSQINFYVFIDQLNIKIQNQIFITVYSRFYVQACNAWWGPSPQLSAWSIQFQRNVATMASRRRHCIRFDRPRNHTPNLPHRWQCLVNQFANRPVIKSTYFMLLIFSCISAVFKM